MGIFKKKEEKNSWFITIEGPEGAGKSSCAEVLVKFFESRNLPVICTREPGGTPLAEKLREVVKNKPDAGECIHPETELLLMEAARAQHVREKIIPALQSGVSVICDRFYDSTTAYQGGGRNIGKDEIRLFNTFASGGCDPDLTILMDLPPEAGFERVARRASADAKDDRFEAENLEFHRKVRQEFLEIARREPNRVKIVDAALSREEVARQVEILINELVR